MIVRQAREEDIPYLKTKLAESGGEQIDLDTARVWVAVEDEQIVGMLAARMTWQIEPLLLWGGNQVTKSRAGVGMYRAAEEWLQENVGVRWVFCITRRAAVGRWLGKLGWLRQYKGAATFVKYVR